MSPRAAVHRARQLAPALLMTLLLGQLAACAWLSPGSRFDRAPATETHYLSGHGPGDAVDWDFQCSDGRRAGEWATIPVPSQWEQHGFGKYNYGREDDAVRAREVGSYRTRFAAPDAWSGRRVRLVFEGVMTDTAARINGKSVGPTHQGGFYRFNYDVTDLLDFGGENRLEVEVAKVSANSSVEAAERRADYWIFGGIFRPVYLEVLPRQFIDWTAVDARADGSFAIDVHPADIDTADRIVARITTLDGKPVGPDFGAPLLPGGEKVRLTTQIADPRLWTAETPHLYNVEVVLLAGNRPLHKKVERFGFRTFEVRPGEGLFLNGSRIFLKGVNRHSFRPETGRALDPADCYEDVRLIKEMNMNAVRMSHYPPDAVFLDACDELGLYVLDELAGWQRPPYDEEVGRKLVREMLVRDVNHPSILFWDNGNEGGWNANLDDDFAIWDPQNRQVLHPQQKHGPLNTKHYPFYDELQKLLEGPELVMPTEILHGLFDGGMGAASEDYWNLLRSSPLGCGLFYWLLADEGLARTDWDGRIDTFGSMLPDGVVGPHLEREASFETFRSLFCPVQIDPPVNEKDGGVLPADFDGALPVRNDYAFTSLDRCRFHWRLVRFASPDADFSDALPEPDVLAEGDAPGPSIAPGGEGDLKLDLPTADLWQADALELTVFDAADAALWTWTWPLNTRPPDFVSDAMVATEFVQPLVESDQFILAAPDAGVTARFDRRTGLLTVLEKAGRRLPLFGGPRLVYAKAPTYKTKNEDLAPEINWHAYARASSSPDSKPADVALAFDDDPQSVWSAPAPGSWIAAEFTRPRPVSVVSVFMRREGATWLERYKLEISPDGRRWKTVFDGPRNMRDEKRHDIPPQWVKAVRLTAGETSDGAPVRIGFVRLGYESARYPLAGVPARVEADNKGIYLSYSGGIDWAQWRLTPRGVLCLSYYYKLPDDRYEYAGITFESPESTMRANTWLGPGPYRVWKNRMRGATLGVHHAGYNENRPTGDWNYPEFQGYFGPMRWLKLESDAGSIDFATVSPDLFFRVGWQRPHHLDVSPNYPAGDLSFLHAIPPIGSKFKPSWRLGPQSEWARMAETYEGRLFIRP
jgi:hypothetical protein